MIGLTNLPGSPLAQVVDRELLAGAGPERAVPAPKTVTAQLALLVTVTSALAAARPQIGPATSATGMASWPGSAGRGGRGAGRPRPGPATGGAMAGT